jgi:hypothetical protein
VSLCQNVGRHRYLTLYKMLGIINRLFFLSPGLLRTVLHGRRKSGRFEQLFLEECRRAGGDLLFRIAAVWTF